MKIDNSSARSWHNCPAAYWEWKVNNLQKRDPYGARSFGKRIHELLEDHFAPVGHPHLPRSPVDEETELEAQEMIEAYKAHYPIEEFEIVDIERYFEVPLPESPHIYHGKIDGIIRALPGSILYRPGCLYVLEHKSERRGGISNLPEQWAARAQVALYQWAARQLYPNEEFDGVVLDVLTRRSPGRRCPADFWRDTLQRTQDQEREAVANITWVADQITQMEAKFPEGEMWPQDREQCMKGRFKCDFYRLHVVGRDEFTLLKDFQPAEQYLEM